MACLRLEGFLFNLLSAKNISAMNKTAIYAYAIDWNGVNYEINLRRIRPDDVSFDTFEEAKAFMLVITADLIAHYKLSHAAWASMSRQDWINRTHKMKQ